MWVWKRYILGPHGSYWCIIKVYCRGVQNAGNMSCEYQGVQHLYMRWSGVLMKCSIRCQTISCIRVGLLGSQKSLCRPNHMLVVVQKVKNAKQAFGNNRIYRRQIFVSVDGGDHPTSKTHRSGRENDTFWVPTNPSGAL